MYNNILRAYCLAGATILGTLGVIPLTLMIMALMMMALRNEQLAQQIAPPHQILVQVVQVVTIAGNSLMISVSLVSKLTIMA